MRRIKIQFAPVDNSPIQSLRIGHATNSSSAHSVIFHAEAGAGGRALGNTPISSIDEYSRDSFIFSEPREKAIYILSSDKTNWLSRHTQISIAPVLQRHGLSLDILQEARDVDLPLASDALISFDFFTASGILAADWLDMMLSPNVTFIGYDDNNDDPSDELTDNGIAVEIDSGMQWRSDNKAIVGYNHASGTKVRWSRDPYEKSGTPELVDVKITDYCGYDCSFCYQGSTKEGAHAPLGRIEEIFDELSAMQVFEVAIGGGEPTQHPQFVEIMRAAHARNLTFNFTAFGLDWLKNEELLKTMKELYRFNNGMGIGISVHSKRDITKIERAQKALRDAGIFGVQIIAQTVVGATPIATFKALLETCMDAKVPLLLLGYKTTGRGADHARKAVSDKQMKGFLEFARSCIENPGDKYLGRFHLSVDTAFLDQFGHVLDEINVPNVLRTSPEGKFSMYIDAVTDMCGPSSYCEPDLMQPRGDIRAQFAQY